MTFLRLIRYKNLIMVLLTMVLVKYGLINSQSRPGALTDFMFLMTAFSIICLTAAGYIVNDILDQKADRVNKPKKVFIGDRISAKNAWILYMILTLIGILSCLYVTEATYLSYGYLIVYVVTSVLLYLYSSHLKKLPLLGNLLIACFCAGIILVIFKLDYTDKENATGFWNQFNDILNNIEVGLMMTYYMIFSFVTTLIREMIKDIEDIDGDHSMNMKTLPIVLGRRRTRNIIIFLSILFLFFLIGVILPFFEDSDGLLLGLYFSLFTFLPFLYFTYKLWSAKRKKEFHFLSNLMKFIMFTGILSMVLFKFM